MRPARLCRLRKKGGQVAWTPASQTTAPSPTVGISGSEAVRLMYRPLPLEQTVDYEEDFGPSVIVQREFFSKRYRDRLSHAIAPLSYSDTELAKARSQLASSMNRERQGSALHGHEVPFETSVDPESREITSARYLFDNNRMDYCKRFEDTFGENQLFSLMEACAILFGCSEAEAREAFYAQFLRLDRDSLEDDTEDVRALAVEAVAANEELAELSQNVADEGEDAVAEALVRLPDELMDLAPTVRSYLAHARGESPIAAVDKGSLGKVGTVQERLRWRRVMEKLVAEDYHTLSALERADAEVLNEQLGTVKLFDLRIGDVVREMAQRARVGVGGRGTLHSDTPLNQSPRHPERRYPDEK